MKIKKINDDEYITTIGGNIYILKRNGAKWLMSNEKTSLALTFGRLSEAVGYLEYIKRSHDFDMDL